MSSGGGATTDEAFPAVFVGRKPSALNGHNNNGGGDGARDEEIDKLKRFLQEKGL